MSKETNKKIIKEFNKFYGAMFECGDFEELLDKISKALTAKDAEWEKRIKKATEAERERILKEIEKLEKWEVTDFPIDKPAITSHLVRKEQIKKLLND